jgi:hypothetical protein
MLFLGAGNRFEVPEGFSMYADGKLAIVLRNDLDPACCDLVLDCRSRCSLQRGRVLVGPLRGRNGNGILTAFRRTVRGGPYSGFGFETTFGRVPRTLIELQVTVAVSKVGAPVVPPLGCYWEWVKGGIGYKSGYFSVYQEKALTLSEVLKAWKDGGISRGRRREVLTQLAGTLKRLHRAGVVHIDLTLGNLLLEPNGLCSFVDLDGAKEVACLSDKALMAAFSRLNRSLEKSGMGKTVPGRDRLWFLRAYLGDLGSHDKLVRKILSRAKRDLAWHRFFWGRKTRAP